MDLRQYVDDWWQGRPERGSRGGKWPKVREEHLKQHSVCEACGGKKSLQVHHILPLSHGGLELEPANLLTLCTDGPGGMNCHLVLGHSGDWKARNSMARWDAADLRVRLESREYPPETKIG